MISGVNACLNVSHVSVRRAAFTCSVSDEIGLTRMGLSMVRVRDMMGSVGNGEHTNYHLPTKTVKCFGGKGNNLELPIRPI
jgi:hypothetical protein